MLSVSAISSAGKAEYYAKDDYYIGQPVTPEDTQLEWGGKGAERLQLEGVAKADDFKQVMCGRNPDPDGAPLSKLEKVEREAAATGASPSPAASHRPGADLTFSAPKGVSVALLVGGDVRLTVAHREAVAEAMGYAEVHLAQARLRNGKGERSVVQTGNLVYAATTHSSSREGDPQLHSHVVVANATYVEQVKDWRALEPKALFANQVLLGQIYRAALAERVQTLGYDIRQHRSGTFELAAFSAAQLAAFSKATERVAKNLAEAQPETGAAKDVVKRLNRPRKLEVAPDQLLARWEREAAAAGFSPKEVVAGAERALVGRDVTDRREGRVGLIDSELARITTAIGDRLAPRRDPYGFSRGERLEGQDLAARAAVSYGLQVNESQRAVFTRHDVLARALEASPATTAARLERQLDALVEDSRVRVADATVLSGVTTATSLGVEAEIVERMRRGLGAGRALFGVEAGLKRVSPDAVLRAGHAHAMNAGQTAAAALILTSADRVIAVHGAAGVGKTTLFEVVVRAAEEKGLRFFGVTPSHSAKANLAEKADTEAAVLAWMTARYGRLAQPGARATAEERREWKGRGLIVDEASMMSNTDAQSLLRIADALKIEKVVLVGDTRQHNSPGAGAPFRHLINEEVPLARVEQIMRQKDPQLHHIVSTLARGEGVNGLRLLGDRVVEVGRGEGDSALAQAAYALWSEGKEAGRSRPIIVQTQAQRSLVSELIVNNLVERGEAVPVGVTSERLVAVQMHGPQRLDAGAYEVGQVLVFPCRLQSRGSGAGRAPGDHRDRRPRSGQPAVRPRRGGAAGDGRPEPDGAGGAAALPGLRFARGGGGPHRGRPGLGAFRRQARLLHRRDLHAGGRQGRPAAGQACVGRARRRREGRPTPPLRRPGLRHDQPPEPVAHAGGRADRGDGEPVRRRRHPLRAGVPRRARLQPRHRRSRAADPEARPGDRHEPDCSRGACGDQGEGSRGSHPSASRPR